MSRLVLTACTLDTDAERVIRASGVVRLTGLETKLVKFFESNPGRDIPRDELLSAVWDYAEGVLSRAVDATINRLRAKIERDPSEPDHVLTVWGLGYRFEPGAPEVPSGLLPELDRFFGREAELTAIGAALAGRLVTLTGPAGLGKTRLAREATRRAGLSAWFVDATEATEAGQFAATVARALGLGSHAIGPGLAARGRALLVLDNLEQVVEAAAPQIREWLLAAPSLTVLATSRERLGIGGENVVELGPLAPDAARALFLDRAAAALPTDALDEVLAALEGIPLALELAAGLTDVLALRALRDRLAAPLDLRSVRRDRPTRHETLRAALEGSWRSLDDDERRILCVASLLRAPFSAETLEAVAGGSATATLASLRAKSLLRRLGDGTLGLFVAVRAFAQEQLSERDDAPAARRRYRAFFAARADAVAPIAQAAPTAAGLAWIASSLDDLHEVLRTAVAAEEPVFAAAVAHALFLLLSLSGPVSGAGDVLDAVLAKPEVHPIRTRGHLHRARAIVYRLVGDGPNMTRALALSRACATDDPLLEGRLLALEGSWSLNQDDPSIARALLERAIALHRAAGDRWYLPASLNNLASTFGRSGEGAARAEALYLEAHRANLAEGNERSAAIALGNYARMLAERGDLTSARPLLERALATHRALADRHHEAVTLTHLGAVAMHAGDLSDAREMFARSLDLDRKVGSRPGPGESVQSRELAAIRHLSGDPEAALIALDEARGRGGRTDDAFLDLLEAAVRIDLGALDQAAGLVARWPIADVPSRTRPMVPAVRGLLALARGDHPAATDALAEARTERAAPEQAYLQLNRLYVERLAQRLQDL